MKGLSYKFLLSVMFSAFLFSCGSNTEQDDTPVVPTPTPPITKPKAGTGANGLLTGQVPSVPQNFEVTAWGSNFIELRWGNSFYEDGYKLEKKVDSGSFSQIGEKLPANTTTYFDSGLEQATQYCYRVKAFNSSGESPYSNEVCQSTSSCSNTTGPTISINAANPTAVYPSVHEEFNFTKENSVALEYRIDDNDGCSSSFAVTVDVYRHGESGYPVFTWAGNHGIGDKSIAYQIPDYGTLPNPEGFYDIVIEATDGEFSDSKSQENYFEVLPLPEDSASPYVVQKSQAKDICPDEPYEIEFVFNDDSVDSSMGGLGSDWIHSFIYQAGVPDYKKHVYSTAAKKFFTYERLESPLDEDITLSYYPNAYDYTLKSIENPQAQSVDIVIKRDTVPPQINFNLVPPYSEIEANEWYTISVASSDPNCSAPVYQRFEFIYPDEATLGSYLLRDFRKEASHTFTLPVSLIGKPGKFKATAKDSSGNTSIAYSPDYIVLANSRPAIEISIDPDPNHPEWFEVNYPTALHVNVISADTTDAHIEELRTHDGEVILSDVPWTGNETVPWTTPSQVPNQDSGTIIYLTVTNNGHLVQTQLLVQIGRQPDLNITFDPAPPFFAGQKIDIHLNVTDNDMTGMQINYLKYYHGSLPSFLIEDPVNYAGNEVYHWEVPLPGSYFLQAELEDNEGIRAANFASFEVTYGSANTPVVYLDYDLNGSMALSEIIRFDLDANGTREWTNWLNDQDGYLTIDRNGNGSIDNGYEFASLNELINEAGSILNDKDSLFNSIKIWVDGNSDGITDPGELKNLEEADIIDITLNPCCSFRRW